MKKYAGLFILFFGLVLLYLAFSGVYGYVDLVPFDEMEYERYDTEKILTLMDSVKSYAGEGNADKAIDSLKEVFSEYSNLLTMETLADIRYCLDMTDDFYAEEYGYMISASSQVSRGLFNMFSSIAYSECADKIEEKYLGKGFLEGYKESTQSENSEKITELLSRENELYVQYRNTVKEQDEIFDPEGMYDPEVGNEISEEEITNAENEYYDRYNPILGEIYVQLVKTRIELAQAYGYDSYEEYTYKTVHGRDYTPEDISLYMQDIIEYIVPVYVEIAMDEKTWDRTYYFPADTDDMEEYVESIASNLGGDVEDAYDFMTSYDLYDISYSPNKMNISFQTYIKNYEAPYLFIDPSGYSDDLLTFSHEFGHYADSYVNYNAVSDTDTAETLSQGMEYLGILYSDLDDDKKEVLLSSKMIEGIEVYIEQAAMSLFEKMVYSLDYEDVTLENINELYCTVAKTFGYYSEEYDNYYHKCWIDVTHFFEYPFYSISYVTSNDAALQIYEAEIEKEGAGVEIYENLLSRNTEQSFLTVLDEAGLESPFSEERILNACAVFREFFGVEAAENAA